MKNGKIVFVGASGLAAVVALVGVFAIVRPVLAQEDASTTDTVSAPSDGPADQLPTSTDSTDDTSGTVLSASSSADTQGAPATSATDDSATAALTDAGADEATTTAGSGVGSDASSSSKQTADTSETPAPQGTTVIHETPPAGLTEVHIIGTKYVDYFTDGTTTISFPGDPNIDAHLSEPNAPIPTHDGLTWVHTTGQPLYDTPSGDLEVGDYAYDANGTLVVNQPPIVSSTSTAQTAAENNTNSSAAPSSASPTSDSQPSAQTGSSSAPIDAHGADDSSSTPVTPTGNAGSIVSAPSDAPSAAATSTGEPATSTTSSQ
jgi:hypothetical protein